jgi:TatD DNase family protein
MANLFDTHFHLDLQKPISVAVDAINESQIYTIAMTNLPDLYKRGKDSCNSQYVRVALGFHPELVCQYKKQQCLMWELLDDARYVGEIGLDYTCKSIEKSFQRTFFEELIGRCRDSRDKILSIHSRRAANDIINIIGEDFKFTPILHWYSGSKRDIELAINRGFYFSVNHIMMRSSSFLSMMSLIPLEKLLLETDSPFTGTISQKGSLEKTIFELSLAKHLSMENMKVKLWNNFVGLLKTTSTK